MTIDLHKLIQEYIDLYHKLDSLDINKILQKFFEEKLSISIDIIKIPEIGLFIDLLMNNIYENFTNSFSFNKNGKEIANIFYNLRIKMKINLDFSADNLIKTILKSLINNNVNIPLLKVHKILKIKNLNLQNFNNEKFVEKLQKDIENEEIYYEFFTDNINDLIDNRRNILIESKEKTKEFYEYLINEIPLFIKKKQEENRRFFVFGDFKTEDYLRDNYNQINYKCVKDFSESFKQKDNLKDFSDHKEKEEFYLMPKSHNENNFDLLNINKLGMKNLIKDSENKFLSRKRNSDNRNFINFEKKDRKNNENLNSFEDKGFNLNKITSFRLESFNNKK